MGLKVIVRMSTAILVSTMPVVAGAAPRNPASSLSIANAVPRVMAKPAREAIGVKHGLVYAGVFAALIATFVVVTAGKDDSPDSP